MVKIGGNSMVAVGDTFSKRELVDNNQYLDIRPEEGQEVIIYNLGTGGAWELYEVSSGGTYPSKLDGKPTIDLLSPLKLIITYSEYYRFKNVSGADNLPFSCKGTYKKV